MSAQDRPPPLHPIYLQWLRGEVPTDEAIAAAEARGFAAARRWKALARKLRVDVAWHIDTSRLLAEDCASEGNRAAKLREALERLLSETAPITHGRSAMECQLRAPIGLRPSPVDGALIAAAPELLAALKALLPHAGTECSDPDECVRAEDAALALIRRIEGD